MKKYGIIILVLVFGVIGAGYARNVLVTAKVGTQNSRPVVINVNPSSDPRLLQKGKSQIYAVYFQDAEKDNITFTITPNTGTVNPTSGNISSGEFDTSSGAYINFTYYAPSVANASEKVFITINDGTNVTVKQLNLYVY